MDRTNDGQESVTEFFALIENGDERRQGAALHAEFAGDRGQCPVQIRDLEDATDPPHGQGGIGDDNPATAIPVELGDDIAERHLVEDQAAAPPGGCLVEIGCRHRTHAREAVIMDRLSRREYHRFHPIIRGYLYPMLGRDDAWPREQVRAFTELAQQYR